MGGGGSKNKQNKKRAAVNTARNSIQRTGFGARARGIAESVSTYGPELFGGDIFNAILNAMKANNVKEVLGYNMSELVRINEGLDANQMTQLHLAAILGKPDIVRALLNFPEADINVINNDGDTPLMSAVKVAEMDHLCVIIVSIFVRDRRCEVAKGNFAEYTPLGAAVAKGFRETTKLLVGGGLIHQYAQRDIGMAIKLAISLDKEALAEIIIGEMNTEARNAFKAYTRGVPELEPICQLLDDEHDTGSQSENEAPSNGHGPLSPGGKPKPNPNPKPSKKATAVITAPEALGKKITADYKGHDIHIGSLVEIMSEDVIRRVNPRIKSEVEFIEGIANQKAFVHEIDDEGDIYVDVLDSNMAGHISPKCVKLLDKGPRSSIADGAVVAVGYYVKVFPNEGDVKELARGHGGWKPKMIDCLGRTGKIRKIDRDGDVFVHFSWGERFCFNPKALLPSSAADVEAKDYNGDWLRKGNLARVTDSTEDFRYFQEEIGYPCNNQLLGKLVAIRKLRLFLQHCDVIVIDGKQTFNLNPKCLVLVSTAQDCNGNEVKVGDFVTVRSEKEEVMALQTSAYGSWTKQMEKVLGLKGRVVEIEVAAGATLTTPVARVKFPDGSFYLNPRSLRRSNEEPNGKSSPIRIPEDSDRVTEESVPRTPGPLPADGEGLQVIPRSELAMRKKLGEGGFGVVTTGSWKGTDCAIKQIRTVVTNQIDYEDILREARIQYNFKHPNIVQLYGISYEGDLWMVMQLVHGTDLHTLLFDPKYAHKDKLQMSTKLKICLQATNAISYLHGRGYLHNDIKPENMIIEKRTGNLFMCDFGITRYLGKLDLHTYTSKYTNTFGGTLPYIAPECFQKDSAEKRHLRPTFKSDVWSLGAVLTELFSEKELFSDEKNLYLCKLMGDYKQVKAMIKTLPQSIIPIIRQALDPSPDKRPTAQEMNNFFFEVSKTQM